MENLISKYNVAGPRYTSYPTVPYWNNLGQSHDSWKQSIVDGFRRSRKEVSIYIHLPFCESLCTYCGCTTRISRDHSVEDKYISYLLREWRMYLAAFHSRPVIKEVHLGGGTPTFFSAGNLRKLMEGLLKNATLAEDHEFGFEGHSNNTTEEHLKTLADLGFTRVSFGVQDFNDEVQQIINRKQSFEQINRVVQLAKKHGFSSINIDLLYGLPKQTAESIMNTIEKTISLRPTRIAFYGYAHIPWIKAAQKSFEQWLPTPGERLEMYELGKKMLAAENYIDIGMDHFALSSDKLYQAFDKGQLHRNFMGYTTQESDLLIGLGMSAISDTWVAFSQNEKLLSKYYQRLDRNEFPIFRGHQLTREDLVIKKHILNLMSRFSTRWDQEELLQLAANYNLDLLEDLASDGLISWNGDGIKVLEAGKPYIRNICMTLDAHLWRTKKLSRFCQTV